MKKSDAVSYYGSQIKLAEAVGRAQSTVAGWPDVIPLEHAFVLEKLTAKRLRVDLTLYPKAPSGLTKQ